MFQPQEDIVCKACGATISVDMGFCPECGADLREGPSGAPPTGPVTQPMQPPMVPRGGEPLARPPPAVPSTLGAIPRGRISVGLLLGVLGLVLAVVAIASISWFVVEMVDGESTMRFGLREVEMEFDILESTSEERESYQTLESQVGMDLEMDDVAGNTWWLLVVGLTLAALFILFALLCLIGALRGPLSWLPVLAGLSAGILVLVAASYFAISFQDTLEEDFDMSLSEAEDTEYGLGGIWYLALVGGILLLLGALLTKAPADQARPVNLMQPMR